jgi:hypothetical protein
VKVPSGNHAKCLPGQEGVRGSYATAEEAALHYARWCAVPPGAILKEEGIRSRLCRPAHSSRRGARLCRLVLWCIRRHEGRGRLQGGRLRLEIEGLRRRVNLPVPDIYTPFRARCKLKQN